MNRPNPGDSTGPSTSDEEADLNSAPTPARPELVEGRKPKSGWVSVLVDWGPVLVFFGTYRYLAPSDSDDALAVIGAAIGATGVFIVAAIVALLVSKFVLGGISRMLGLSTLLIVGFGALTVLLADPFWIQLKPTAFYVFFGAVLLAGWMRGKALLQWALEAAFEGLSDAGWLKLSRNWGLFFLVLAALFVQVPTMPKVPAELKKGVTGYIAPSALFFFRWGAALTVLTGLSIAFHNGYGAQALTFQGNGADGINLIGIGMWLALIMAFNVWVIIWPNQKKILGLVEASDEAKAKAAPVALAASRINVMLSLPMAYAMVSANLG